MFTYYLVSIEKYQGFLQQDKYIRELNARKNRSSIRNRDLKARKKSSSIRNRDLKARKESSSRRNRDWNARKNSSSGMH